MRTLSILAIDAYKTAAAAREEERLDNERKQLAENLKFAKDRLQKALGGIEPETLWDAENPPAPGGPFRFMASDLIFEIRTTRYSRMEVLLLKDKCPRCQEQLVAHLPGLVYYDDPEQARKVNFDHIGGAILGDPEHHTCPPEETTTKDKPEPRKKNFEERLGEQVLELFTEIGNFAGVRWED